MKQPARFKGFAMAALVLLWGCGGDPIPPEPPPMPVEEEPVEETEIPSSEPVEVERVVEPVPGSVSPEPVEGEPEPESAPPPETAPETMAEPDVVVPVQGSIVSRKGKKVIIETDETYLPEEGAKGTLSKYFEKQVGPFATSGWLGIAEVTVKKVADGKLHLQIDEELSKMVVNGKKVDHFKKGNTVKLELE